MSFVINNNFLYEDNLISFSPNFYNAPYYSGTPLYFLRKAPSFTNIYNENYTNIKKFNFNISISKDIIFDFNGITYKNDIDINEPNVFLKSNSFTYTEQSILSMFSQNGTLDDFYLNFTRRYTVAGFDWIEFSLTSKIEGNLVQIENFTNDDYGDNNTSITISGSNFTITSLISFGRNESLDLERYEIGLDIYSYTEKVTPNIPYPIFTGNKTYITSLSKKGTDVGDFNLSSIVQNYITDWKPSITDFSINNNKWCEVFKVDFWKKYKKPDSNFVNKLYTADSDSITIIDGYTPLFENYDYTLNKSLESENAGTYGDFNNSVYDKNLTNQPKYKKINKSFEMLCNYVNLYGIYNDTILPDQVYFKFIYQNNSTETIVLDNNNLQNSNEGSYYYINQLCFNVKNLKNQIVGDFNLVKQIDVNFFNPSYSDYLYGYGLPVKYETQSYYIDQTVQTCDDSTDSEIDYTPIVFKNSRGGFDLFEFETIQELKTKRNYDSFVQPFNYTFKKTSEFEKVFNLDYKKTYSLKTRILDNDEFVWLEDLIKSKKVYILNLNDNQLYPIIISDTDYGFKTNTDKQISITFNYSRPDTTA